MAINFKVSLYMFIWIYARPARLLDLFLKNLIQSLWLAFPEVSVTEMLGTKLWLSRHMRLKRRARQETPKAWVLQFVFLGKVCESFGKQPGKAYCGFHLFSWYNLCSDKQLLCTERVGGVKAVVLITSSKPEAAGSPVQPTVSAAVASLL